MKKIKVNWDINGVNPVAYNLPRVVEVPSNVTEENVADWLFVMYGFCVESWKYTMVSEKTIAFVESLVKAKTVTAVALKREYVLKKYEEIVNLPNQEAADAISATVGMIYHKYTDWVETYNK